MLDCSERTNNRLEGGLVGMRERVALLGGTLKIESFPGRGTTLSAYVPLSDRAVTSR